MLAPVDILMIFGREVGAVFAQLDEDFQGAEGVELKDAVGVGVGLHGG